jgi:glycosyltransferase involved in cell wall biosynthesis
MKPAPSNKSARVKILFCIDQLVRGGTELQLIGLIDHLDRDQYSPYLLTIRPTDPELIPEDCEHVNLSVPKLFSMAGLRSLCWLVGFMRRENIQVVQTYFQDSTIFAGLAARIAKTPARIACFRDLAFWNSRKQATLLKWIYPMMNGYIGNANVVLDHFARTFGIDLKRARVVRNGVDASQLLFQEHLGTTTDIGVVGNMTRPVKRTDLFIRAAAIVHRHYPDVRWHIVGDGHLRPELEKLAEELGVSGRMIFAGRIEDVTGYLGKLQAGVICSDSEGLSNAILEYMFRGVATVATEVGGNTELVENGKTGLTIPPDSADALAAALTHFIKQPESRQAMAKAARHRVERSYSWERCLSDHDQIYRSLLAGRVMEPSA